MALAGPNPPFPHVCRTTLPTLASPFRPTESSSVIAAGVLNRQTNSDPKHHRFPRIKTGLPRKEAHG
jgi:hypothetical protein